MIEAVFGMVIALAPAEDDPGWDWATMGNRTRMHHGVCETATDYGIVQYAPEGKLCVVPDLTYNQYDFEPDTGSYIGGFN